MLTRNKRNDTGGHKNPHDTSLIARGTEIQGDLRFSGALHLDGCIEGTVVADDDNAMFTLSEFGQVKGEVSVPHAVINGHIIGNVTVAAKLELAPQARIDGDLRYHTMEMASGAQVNGRISRLADAPAAELPAPVSLVADDAMAS